MSLSLKAKYWSWCCVAQQNKESNIHPCKASDLFVTLLWDLCEGISTAAWFREHPKGDTETRTASIPALNPAK